MQSQAELIAFLDADDEYQQDALSAACFSFQQFDFLGLIRLRLQAVGLPEHYRTQPDFARAWHSVQMTVGGNTVFRRVFFLACGGFPHDELFRQFGGEDGALGLATVGSSVVGTLFDEHEPAVLHHWRDGIHAAHLLDVSPSQVQSNRAWAAREIANRYRAWCILKGHETVISSARGFLHINKTGNAGLATAGSGDGLS